MRTLNNLLQGLINKKPSETNNKIHKVVREPIRGTKNSHMTQHTNQKHEKQSHDIQADERDGRAESREREGMFQPHKPHFTPFLTKYNNINTQPSN